MALNIGRQGKLFGIIETGGYGTTQAITAANALRHIDFQASYDPFSRVGSEEKKTSPGKVTVFNRRPTAALGSLAGLLRPSGTLNTVPECSPVLEAGFGSKVNVTLATAIGVPVPTCALLPAEAGLVESGAHYYKVVFMVGALHSLPSAHSLIITTDAGHGKVTVTIPKGPTGTTGRQVFRTEADADPEVAANYKLVGAEVANNTDATFADNFADASLGAVAPTTDDTTTLLTATGGYVLAAGTLAVGDAILITHGGKKYARFITAIATTNLAWAPPLPAAVVTASVIKAGITYKLTTANAVALALFHYLSGYKRELRGVGIDKLALAFDANLEPRFTASGPAQRMLTDAATVAEPGGFTTVGGNPPSGIIGDCYIGSTAYLVKKSDVEIANALKLRNEEYGSAADDGLASELYREGRRGINVSVDAFVETAATLHDLAIAGTQASFFKQTGRTEGNIVACYAPKVDWKVPDMSSGDAAADWAFKGEALESADGMNDELYLALL